MPDELIQLCNEFGWWSPYGAAAILVWAFFMGVWNERRKANKRLTDRIESVEYRSPRGTDN